MLATMSVGAWAAFAGDSKPPLDLSGTWRFDPGRSDAPPAWGGGGHGGGGHGGGGGGWSGHHGGYHGAGGYGGGVEGGEGGEAHARPMRLPDLLCIEEQPEYVVLQDSTGADLMQIVIGEKVSSTSPSTAGPVRVQGEWKKDHLEAKHEDDRGFKVTQTYALSDKGRTLEIDTKVEGRRSFETKRVYDREGAAKQ